MQFDMTKKKDGGPVPAGNYDVIIEKAEEKTYNESVYLELTLRLNNRRIVWDRVYGDNPNKAAFVCEAAGVKFDGTLEPNLLVGHFVNVEVAIDESKDKPRNRVVAYRPVVDGEEQMSESVAVKASDIPF